MRSGNRNLAICLLAAAFALPAGVVSAPAWAQETDDESLAAAQANGPKTKADPKDAKAKGERKSAGPEEKAGAPKKDPNIALKAYELGTKAYETGKLEPATQAFSTALANGGLPPDKMAKAYYYRGLAYKKLKKPAQALSDFTIAVWVNGGLNDTDRAAALDQRNAVYREAGLGDQAPPITTSSAPAPLAPAAQAAAAKPQAPAAPATPPPAAAPPPQQPPAVTQAAAPAPAERPVWQAEPDSKPPPPPSADAYVPPSPSPVEPAQAAVPASGLAASPEAAPQQSGDTVSSVAKAGDSIGSFFANMFGQSSPPPPPSPTVTTGSTPPVEAGWNDGSAPHPAGPVAQVSASEPQRAPGYETTAATPAPSPAAAASPVKASAPKTSAGGKYRLQLASVRSREEADRLVQNLMTAHAEQIGSAEPAVDETVIGNMGTFYRVRLGPYANASEPTKLCSTLKPQGFDCQVVTK